MTSPRLFLGAALLEAGRGGIAKVARMMARSAMSEAVDLRVMSFLDKAKVDLGGLRATSCRGSKLAFATGTHVAAIRATHFLYDSVGIAGAHPRLPGMRRPYAVFIHGIEVWEGIRRDHLVTIAGADLVLVNSAFTLARFESLHGALPKARVCELGTEEDGEAAGVTFEGAPTVLMVGRIETTESYKGHRQLIDCWPKVVAAVPDAQLVIAGGGSGLAALRAQASLSPAAASIHIKGFVPEPELPGLWRRTHVLAMPSRGEGFGLVYVEAMRLGIPVVASRHDAGQEVNVDGVTGFNVDMDAADELPERLIRLLANRNLARQLGAQGQARWRENYRFSGFRSRFLEVLRPFLEGP